MAAVTVEYPVKKEVIAGFEPLVIIEFKPQTLAAAQEWLTAKLQAPRSDNGAELIVKTNTFQHSKVSINFSMILLQNTLL